MYLTSEVGWLKVDCLLPMLIPHCSLGTSVNYELKTANLLQFSNRNEIVGANNRDETTSIDSEIRTKKLNFREQFHKYIHCILAVHTVA